MLAPVWGALAGGLGVPGVFFMDEKVGLPLNETLIAGQLKKAQYATMAVGK